jgi:hypothetical protein
VLYHQRCYPQSPGICFPLPSSNPTVPWLLIGRFGISCYLMSPGCCGSWYITLYNLACIGLHQNRYALSFCAPALHHCLVWRLFLFSWALSTFQTLNPNNNLWLTLEFYYQILESMLILPETLAPLDVPPHHYCCPEGT